MLYLMDKKIILSNLLFSIVITKATSRLKVTYALSRRGSWGSTWRHDNHIYGVLLTASINDNTLEGNEEEHDIENLRWMTLLDFCYY